MSDIKFNHSILHVSVKLKEKLKIYKASEKCKLDSGRYMIGNSKFKAI